MGAELLSEPACNDLGNLAGSICLYKNQAVLVRRTDYEGRVQISYLKDPFVTETIDHRDKAFRYNSPPLGYMNINKEALYLKRSAGYGRSAAITQDTLNVAPNSLVDHLYSVRDCPEGKWTRRKEFAQCVEGDHPDFYEAFTKIMDNEVNSIAFHRTLALRRSDRGRLILEKRGTETIAVMKSKKIILMDDSIHGTLLRFLPKDIKENGFDVSTL